MVHVKSMSPQLGTGRGGPPLFVAQIFHSIELQPSHYVLNNSIVTVIVLPTGAEINAFGHAVTGTSEIVSMRLCSKNAEPDFIGLDGLISFFDHPEYGINLFYRLYLPVPAFKRGLVQYYIHYYTPRVKLNFLVVLIPWLAVSVFQGLSFSAYLTNNKKAIV
ncbi:hypothetical protein Pelo_14200 [Pelomyxa schiedti]|nr:hypothetical protein Pelo_14200 [Pelomyxa schiedti]